MAIHYHPLPLRISPACFALLCFASLRYARFAHAACIADVGCSQGKVEVDVVVCVWIEWQMAILCEL